MSDDEGCGVECEGEMEPPDWLLRVGPRKHTDA